MSDPTPVGGTAASVVDRIERIMERKRETSGVMAAMWQSGEIDKRSLPCADSCTGDIMLLHKGQRYAGQCPVFMREGVCPLVTLEERRLYARMTHAGFGERYHNPDPDRIRARSAVEQFLGNLQDNLTRGRGLLMTGDVGVGKTMTLAYLARRMLIENVGVWCVHMPEFIEMLNDRDTRKAVVERAIKVEVLMLDDLGSGDMPTWVLGILEGIVEHRYGGLKTTVVSSNLSREILTTDPKFRRMVDRWRESNTLVKVGGASQRHGD